MARALPHAVNNILVAELGDEEILLCACDDGDVIAYWTKSIHEVVERIKLSETVESQVGHDLKPFFHVNVEKSAWGLAVHKEARLIGVSSNTAEVNVYAFALTTISSGAELDAASSTSSLQDEWLNRTSFDPEDDTFTCRKQNLRIRLLLHEANIPSITFCNTGEDPRGRLLVSTDITAMTVLWNVKSRQPIRRLFPTAGIYEEYHTRRSGWGLLFIEKRAFSKTTSVVQATGTCTILHHSGVPSSVAITSESKRMVRRSRPWQVADREKTALSNREISSEDEGGQENENLDSVLFPYILKGESSAIKTTLRANMAGRVPAINLIKYTKDQLAALDPATWPGITHIVEQYAGHDRWVEDGRVIGYSSSNAASPLLLLNPQALSLIQSAWLNRSDTASPTIYLDDPLEQAMPVELRHHLQRHDRLNLYTQIPQMGVVLVGSQAGRVAVLTLHQLEPKPFDPEAIGPVYTMRLDHLLPFSSQEQRKQRPTQPLVGLAASPLQGSRGTGSSARCRIMLLYQDHTILSYEIVREDVGGAESDLLLI